MLVVKGKLKFYLIKLFLIYIIYRAKRAAIQPSKVEPIEHTLPPQENQFESFSKAQNDVTTFDDELQSSIPEACQPGSVTTVTVTETLTITKLWARSFHFKSHFFNFLDILSWVATCCFIIRFLHFWSNFLDLNEPK